MIRFEIYDESGRFDRSFCCRDGRFGDELYMDIYDYLIRRFELEHDEADDAVSWCDLASVGECYEHEKYTIEVCEEE